MLTTTLEKGDHQREPESRTQHLRTRMLVRIYDCPSCRFILFGSPEHCPSCGMSVNLNPTKAVVEPQKSSKVRIPKIVSNRTVLPNTAEWSATASNILTGAFGILLVTLAALALRQ